ncbi:MAG: adenine phosphoribosyltransferase [bacterium]
MDLKSVIVDIPDFPQPGIIFRDLTPILENPDAFRVALDQLVTILADLEYTKLAGIESRGFLFAAPLARQLGIPLVLLRKAGKLPREVEAESYALEYGQATLEVHRDSLGADDRVVILDDLLATGGTAAASGRLVQKLGARVAAYLFVVELAGLHGRDVLTDAPVFSLVNYE